MVVNMNLDIENRLQEMYKSMLNMPKPEEKKEVSPDEFWSSMQMVARNNQALVRYQVR